MSQSRKIKRAKAANLPALCRERIGICTIALTLSSKRGSGEDRPIPVCLRFSINGARWYYLLGDSFTVEQFARICRAQKGLRPHAVPTLNDGLWAKREEYTELFRHYVARIRELSQHKTLTLDLISATLTGKSADGNHFLAEWEKVIAAKRPGTAESYRYALRSFRELTGFSPRDGFLVNAAVLGRWVREMKAKDYSKATMGIYLRACRVVVKECIRGGYIKAADYPFSEREAGLVSIPKGRSRKDRYLSVEQMTELYHFFAGRREGELPLRYAYQRDLVHRGLGLFLFQYLANGMNLSDVARLRYDDWWFAHGGASLRFERQKTRDRTDDNSEVIVPVIPPLGEILREIAAPVRKGALLFPFILEEAMDEAQCRKKVNLMNSNIAARMKIVARHLGWTVAPSPTWCRHSFATNLALQGVPSRYISESMGHSLSKDVTGGYIAEYPPPRQMEFNARLLASDSADAQAADSLLSSLSEAQKEALLRRLLDGKNGDGL